MIVRMLLDLVHSVVQCLEFALARFCFFDSQRAEYIADGLAAKVAGSDPSITSLEGAALSPLVSLELAHAYPKSGFRGTQLLEKLGNAVTQASNADRERQLQKMREEQISVDKAHPPANLRIAFLSTLDLPMDCPFPDLLRLAGVETEFSELKEQTGLSMLRDRVMN